MPQNNKRKKGYRDIVIVGIVMCVIVVVAVVAFLIGSRSSSEEDSSADYTSNGVSEIVENSVDASSAADTSDVVEESSKPVADQIVFTDLTVDSSSYAVGNLAVVNEKHVFNGTSTAELVNIYRNKTDSYGLSGVGLTIDKNVMTPMNEMLDALYQQTLNNKVVILSSHKTDTASDAVTGLSFYACVSGGNINEGKFKWLSENCHNYGFVNRYPAGKSAVTGVDANEKNATYRYVGEPHAYLINLNSWCLEEYVEFTTRFSYENPYEYNSRENGATYLIYYVPVSSGEQTVIKVPLDLEYEISGDNIGGFIVTAIKY